MFTITIASIITAGLFLGLILAAWLVSRRQDGSEGRWLDDRWADLIADMKGPAPWDGTTWDLPEQDAYGEWFTPTHDPERISFAAYEGDEPEFDTEQLGVDIEAFIERMKADTTQFIARIHEMA